MKVTMLLTEGPEAGKRFEFNQADTFLLGRSKKAHLRFDRRADTHISRTHFLLEIRPPRCMIIDLNSTNGTRVNGKDVQKTELKDGDEIQVGKTVISMGIKWEDVSKAARVHCSLCRKDVTDEARKFAEEELEYLAYTCRSCQLEEEQRLKQERAERLRRVSRSPVGYCCMTCAVDLSDRADADGKAIWMEDGLYLCQRCGAQEQEMGLEFKTMGDYLILSVLGEGGMGIVYKAVHQETRRICAIKKVHPDCVRDEHARRLFEREINVQSKIIHPNLVRFWDFGRAGIAIFFVTELMAGGDVESLITEVLKRPLEHRLACGMTMQILNGLQALHSKGFIHRDLKPPNFLLSGSHTNRDLLVKISDYGLAKSYEEAGNSLFDYTRAGHFAGSYMFMAPEQITDYRYVKPSADVYSVGVSLYYMLCGAYTVDFPAPLELMMQVLGGKKAKDPVEMILEAPPIPLLKRKPDVPKSLAKVVDKAVKKDLKKRYQSGEEFREELQRVAKLEGWSKVYQHQ